VSSKPEAHASQGRVTTILPGFATATARNSPDAVEIAAWELIDKITILEIKSKRLTEAAKLHHVGVELEVLRSAQAQALEPSSQLQNLTDELRTVNETLWQVEDEIRWCESRGDLAPGSSSWRAGCIGTTTVAPASSARSMSCSAQSWWRKKAIRLIHPIPDIFSETIRKGVRPLGI
jgi:hypothetical protein